MTMNPDIKDRWTAALRSGEYPQTQGVLHRLVGDPKPACTCGLCEAPVGFCCLGVLCELAVADGIITSTPNSDGIAMVYGLETGVLPLKVVKWAGLDSRNPTIGDASLSFYNDIRKYTFDQIADLVEEYL